MARAPAKAAAPAVAEPGHNKPAILTADMLARDFAHLQTSLDEIAELAKNNPPVAEDDEDLEILRTFVRRCMADHKRFETVRVETKEPYLSAERCVDSHFNALKKQVADMQATAEAVAKRLLVKRENEERARLIEEARQRAEEARIAAEKAREAEALRIREEQDRLDREHEALAAAFVSPGIVPSPAEPERHPVSEGAARTQETMLRTEAIQANVVALRAQEATQVKATELVRTRTGDGMTTLAETWHFEVTNIADVDLNALREYVPLADIEKAVRRFVAVHKGTRTLAGVRIYSDRKPVMT